MIIRLMKRATSLCVENDTHENHLCFSKNLDRTIVLYRMRVKEKIRLFYPNDKMVFLALPKPDLTIRIDMI
jgi:hypothetical protein